MRYIDRSTGKKLVFKNKAEYLSFVERTPEVKRMKDRRRTPSGVTRRARHERHGAPPPPTMIPRISPRYDAWPWPPRLVKPKGHVRQKFSIVHPTRGRPSFCAACVELWCNKFSGLNELEYILSLDSDDARNYMQVVAEIAGYFPIRVLVNQNRSVVDAMNNGAEISTGDVLLYVSDDFECPLHWDLEIQKRVRKSNKDGQWVLEVNDGIQPSYDNSIQTILILSRGYYESAGYLYYPEYISVWGDNDFTQRARLMGVNIPAWDLVFKHNHYSIGGLPHDDTYRRENSPKAYQHGEAVYRRREKDHFGVEGLQCSGGITGQQKKKGRRSAQVPG